MSKLLTDIPFSINDHVFVIRGPFMARQGVMLEPRVTSKYSVIMIDFKRTLIPTKDLVLDRNYYKEKYRITPALRTT